MNNSNTTAFVLQRQIRAMDCPCYEIGVYRREASAKPGAMLLRQWDTAALEHAIPWLRYQNYRGCDIYIRPAGSPHPLNLVDDLTAEDPVTNCDSR